MTPASALKIDQPVQQLPTPVAQSPNPPGGRSHCERRHQQQTRHSRRNEPPFDHILPHRVASKPLSSQIHVVRCSNAVEKRKQPQKASEPDQLRLPQQRPQRSDGQRDQQKPQRPVAREMGDELDRIGGQIIFVAPPKSRSAAGSGTRAKTSAFVHPLSQNFFMRRQ